jgi:hypothetical protein
MAAPTYIKTREYADKEPKAGSDYDDGTFGLEFFPFHDDTLTGRAPEVLITPSIGMNTSSMNTSAFDHLRQGVEIRTAKHWLGSNQPKLWSGNYKHYTRIMTYGQMRSWTEYQNSITYDDEIIPFSPVQYIESQKNGTMTYPLPIYFNNGPQEGEEAAIEPLTKPFRLEQSYIEGAYPARRPKGNIEDGNPTQDIPQSNNRILQFIDYEAPLVSDPFLDAGAGYIGDGPIEDCIIIEGYVDFVQRMGTPFDDTENEEIIKQLSIDSTTSGSQAFLGVLYELHMELDDDIRGSYTQKSATAGYSVYGPEQSRYGTDSIAYVGWLRGS